ncbi:MobF family relaxase [Nocardia sp. NPDC055321]
MTIKAVHAGDGFLYLANTVANGDRKREKGQSLTDYYTATGTPPGQWFGRGAQLLGVDGEVTEAQMRALFGEGIHPEADRIILDAINDGKTVPEALRAAALGTGHNAIGSGPTAISVIYNQDKATFLATHQRSPNRQEWLDLRIGAARKHLLAETGQTPTPDQINAALAGEKQRSRSCVAFYDMTATWTKSESIQWGLLGESDRQRMWDCHLRALHATLETAQERYAFARRGAGGKRVIDAEGLTFAIFHHWDNRAGDPNPHSHVMVSSRVLGSDGKWSALDARALYQATVSLSCEYNARKTAELKREFGYRYEERYRNGTGKAPVLEIADVPEAMIRRFSRRPTILVEVEKLVADYRAKHGRNPSKKTQIDLAQQATLATRQGKPVPKSLAEMVAEWAREAEEFLGDGRTGEQFANDIIRLSNDPNAPRIYDPHRTALAIGVRLGGSVGLAELTRNQVRADITAALENYLFADESARAQAASDVFDLLDPEHENNLLDQVEMAANAARRTAYDPETLASDVLRTVSRRRATWTETHIRAAAEDRVSVCDFATEHDHREAVEQLVAAVLHRSIALTIDPDPVPAALARRNGEHIFSRCAATTERFTSQEILDAENALRAAATDPTTLFLSTAAIDTAITQTEDLDHELNAGQREIVRHLCASGTRLAVAIGPAGTGKTTAMKAVARAWNNAGHDVIALAAQKSAARALGAEMGTPARTIASLLTLAEHGGDINIAPGTMLLVDEAGMACTHDLAALQTIAAECGAIVRWIGDPHQLAAIGAGGALRLLAKDTHAPHLAAVVRFTDSREAAASLELRDGDPDKAWEFYKSSGRVVSGMADELRAKILDAHLNDLEHGATSLMMAATLTDVHLLNGAAQAARALNGNIDTTSAGTALADGHTAYIGDLITTRKNTNRLRITGGCRAGDPIDNGEQWTVRTVHADGSLTVAGVGHRGFVRLPARYVADNTELGYACTVHRAQGMTVQRSYLLMGTALGRSLAYVGLTRGSDYNGLFLTTDTLPDVDLHHPPDAELTDHQVWQRGIAREDDNLTATEVLRTEFATIDDPERLREIYDHARELLAHARLEDLLDRTLPAALFERIQQSEHYSTLLDTLDRADQHGLDSVTLVGLIATDRWRIDDERLSDTDDPAAVLRWRADSHIGRRLGRTYEDRFLTVRDLPAPELAPVPARHPGTDTELADYAADLRTRLAGGEHAPNDTENAPAAQSLEPSVALHDRVNRLRREYTRSTRVLGRDWARHELAHILPTGLYNQIQAGRRHDYLRLLDTVATVRSAGLDTTALLREITTTGQTHSPVNSRAAATVLADLAEAVIERHRAETGEPLAAESDSALVPPQHPGHDRPLTEHATDLLRQIRAVEDLQRIRALPSDPLWALDGPELNREINRLRRTLTTPNPMAFQAQTRDLEPDTRQALDRHTTRLTATSARLDRALAEKARRRGLSPSESRAEQSLRAQHRSTEAQTSEYDAPHAQAPQQTEQSLDTGMGL